MAQSKVAAKEQTATGLSGSGGAVRVPAPKQAEEQPAKPADRDAAQRKAEKEAEAAKRWAMMCCCAACVQLQNPEQILSDLQAARRPVPVLPLYQRQVYTGAYL